MYCTNPSRHKRARIGEYNFARPYCSGIDQIYHYDLQFGLVVDTLLGSILNICILDVNNELNCNHHIGDTVIIKLELIIY